MLGDALNKMGKSEQAKLAIERAGLIEQTVSLGNEMASNPQRDVRKISVLIGLARAIAATTRGTGVARDPSCLWTRKRSAGRGCCSQYLANDQSETHYPARRD